ncbi:HEAT repeat domain-containing protein [Myxococcus qinghaiensis]|uniref:HEAT repeat domain-containing protein n=1 Tax=Myxococcus qinghaiensis TaxID=2906758 RepID=UPI0020A78789|nr:HEAT repeat domain-containing protein [Myxococcus qinghaiensis]MCP3170052.1 HEAT repeat domain-containing protein [Myxococcus qinghaiensis]
MAVAASRCWTPVDTGNSGSVLACVNVSALPIGRYWVTTEVSRWTEFLGSPKIPRMDDELPVADLVRRLATGSQLECIESAKELARRKDRRVLSEVISVLQRGESGHSREMAAWLLGELRPGTELTLDALHATIIDPNTTESLRGQAMESLGNQVSHLKGGDVYERAADVLIPLLQHPSVEVLYNAVFALGTMRCRRARPELVRLAAHDRRTYRGLETIGENAQFAIECIDYEPHGR